MGGDQGEIGSVGVGEDGAGGQVGEDDGAIGGWVVGSGMGAGDGAGLGKGLLGEFGSVELSIGQFI